MEKNIELITDSAMPKQWKQPVLKWNAKTFDVKPLLKSSIDISPIYTSSLGALFSSDCLKVLPFIKDAVVDTVFADPPFNLGKQNGRDTDDRRSDEEYVTLYQVLLAEYVRILKPSGARIIEKLVKWNRC